MRLSPRLFPRSHRAPLIDSKRAIWLALMALTLFTTSGAGYYAQASYKAYLEKGWYIGAVASDPSDPLATLGTITSVALCVMLVLTPPAGFSRFVIAFLAFQLWIAVSSLVLHGDVAALVLVAKTVIYVLALGEIVRRLNYRQVITVATIVAAAICAVSLYLSATDPIFRISIGADGWRGLFAQKNGFAAFSLFSLILIFPAIYTAATRWMAAGATIMLLGCIALSQGKAAMGIAIAYLTLTGLMFHLIGERDLRASLSRLSVGLAMALVLGLGTLAVAIAAGWADLTGRVGIWATLLGTLDDRVLTGAGSSRLEAASGLLTIDSSYVAILYNQGAIGLFLYAGIVAVIWAQALHMRNRYSIVCLLTLTVYLVQAVVESSARLGLTYPGIVLLIQLMIAKRLGHAGWTDVARGTGSSTTVRRARRRRDVTSGMRSPAVVAHPLGPVPGNVSNLDVPEGRS